MTEVRSEAIGSVLLGRKQIIVSLVRHPDGQQWVELETRWAGRNGRAAVEMTRLYGPHLRQLAAVLQLASARLGGRGEADGGDHG